MSYNSEVWPIREAQSISTVYGDPVLIKDGDLSRLYRVSRAGKYFIIKTAKEDYGLQMDLIRREYELSIELSHPHIVSVFTFEEETPVGSGIIMEYIDGCNLSEFLSQNPSKQLRERIVGQLMDAVAYLHRKGVIHNDLKPENILISMVDNTLKIIDFGLSDNDAYFLYKSLGCTPKYASPELRSHQPTDCRSDIYSLGMLAKEILNERRKGFWRKAISEDKRKRYANVEQMQKALKRGKNIAMYGSLLLIILLASMSYFIKKVEYYESVTYIQDTTGMTALQKSKDSLQLQLDILKETEAKRDQLKHFSDSVLLDIDKRVKEIYLPILEILPDITNQDECYELLNEAAPKLSEIYQSYYNITADHELISVFDSYYTRLQVKYHNQCINIILGKAASSGIE